MILERISTNRNAIFEDVRLVWLDDVVDSLASVDLLRTRVKHEPVRQSERLTHPAFRW